MVDPISWWNSLDLYWKRIIRIKLKPELEHDKAARDLYTPPHTELSALLSQNSFHVPFSSIPTLDPLRGFSNLESLTIDGLDYLKSADALFDLKSLKHLSWSLHEKFFPVLSKINWISSLVVGGLHSLDIIKDFKSLHSLNIYGSHLNNLNGLDVFHDLEDLSLYNTTFNDLTPVSSLQQLKKLKLIKGNFTTLETLSSLKSLTELELNNLPIQSLKGLEAMTALQHLKVESCNKVSLSSLFQLEALRSLELINTEMVELDEIYSLPPLMNFKITTHYYNPEKLQKLRTDFPHFKIPKEFRFKQGRNYEVIKDFQSRETMVKKGMKFQFLRPNFNHYDGIMICHFKNIENGKEIVWEYRVEEYKSDDEMLLEYFKEIWD